MTKTENDEAYEEGFEAGRDGGFLEDILNSAIPSFSKRGEIFEKGYLEGMMRRDEDSSDEDDESCEGDDEPEYDEEEASARLKKLKSYFTTKVTRSEGFRSFYRRLAHDEISSPFPSETEKVEEVRSVVNLYLSNTRVPEEEYDIDDLARRLARILEKLYTNHFKDEGTLEAKVVTPTYERVKHNVIEEDEPSGLGTVAKIVIGAILVGCAYAITYGFAIKNQREKPIPHGAHVQYMPLRGYR